MQMMDIGLLKASVVLVLYTIQQHDEMELLKLAIAKQNEEINF